MTLVALRPRRAERVAILYGEVAPEAGPDEEDVLVEVDVVQQALTGLGYRPVPVPLTLDLGRARTRLMHLRPAFVFNLVESIEGQGRLIHLAPSLLEALGLPYTGASARATWLTSQKPMAKRLMAAAGVATPSWAEGDAARAPDWDAPSIVKSVWEHASIGIDGESIVAERRKVAAIIRRRQRQLGGEWFAERFVDGREFNLSLLAAPLGVELLPPAEMWFRDYPPDKPRIVDYAAKWHAGSFEFQNTVRRFDFPPADRPLLERVAATALACWRLFGLGGYARVDIRVDAEGVPWVLEVNINPCLSPDAGFLAAAGRAGLGLPAVVERIVGDLNRPAARPVNVPRAVPVALPRMPVSR